LLGLFESAGIALRYEKGRLKPWPRDKVTPGLWDLIKRYRPELRELLSNDVIRFESYAKVLHRRFYRSHGIKARDAFELVGSHVFRFADVRAYYEMQRRYRPPN
jgi:hypothetical protein